MNKRQENIKTKSGIQIAKRILSGKLTTNESIEYTVKQSGYRFFLAVEKFNKQIQSKEIHQARMEAAKIKNTAKK